MLDWLHQRGVTADDCRSIHNYALRQAVFYERTKVLEWLATKLTLAEFVLHKCGNVWLRVQHQARKTSMLTLVVAGKHRQIRLPPELWELVEKLY